MVHAQTITITDIPRKNLKAALELIRQAHFTEEYYGSEGGGYQRNGESISLRFMHQQQSFEICISSENEGLIGALRRLKTAQKQNFLVERTLSATSSQLRNACNATICQLLLSIACRFIRGGGDGTNN